MLTFTIVNKRSKKARERNYLYRIRQFVGRFHNNFRLDVATVLEILEVTSENLSIVYLLMSSSFEVQMLLISNNKQI